MTATTSGEGLDGYVPPPYVPPSTLDERLATAWREITRTPGRAALATLDLCALVGVGISLRPIPVSTADAAGPLHARCGIQFYLAGSSNHAVTAACRYAYASRVPSLIVLSLVAIGATALLMLVIARPSTTNQGSGVRRLWHEVTGTPARAALATFDAAALLGLLAAAQPVTLFTADGRGAFRAHCGLQYYIFGTVDSAVSHACRHAYGPRATVFFIMLVVLLVGASGLAMMVRPASDRRARG